MKEKNELEKITVEIDESIAFILFCILIGLLIYIVYAWYEIYEYTINNYDISHLDLLILILIISELLYLQILKLKLFDAKKLIKDMGDSTSATLLLKFISYITTLISIPLIIFIWFAVFTLIYIIKNIIDYIIEYFYILIIDALWLMIGLAILVLYIKSNELILKSKLK